MKRCLLIFIPLFITGILYTGYTCGPHLPSSYLSGMEAYVLGIPRTVFNVEIYRMLHPEIKGRAFENKFNVYYEDAHYTNRDAVNVKYEQTQSWQNTLNADEQDLMKALKDTGMQEDDLKELVTRYSTMRKDMNEQYPTEYLYGNNHKEKDPFAFTRYNGVLNAIPTEFRLYAEGAAAYRANRFDTAVSKWKDLLALPQDERQYRSTWSAYMLGKTALVQDSTYTIRGREYYRREVVEYNQDATQALQYFHQTQALADEGFIDTPGLAIDSNGWIAHCQYLLGNYKEAIHYYLNHAKAEKRAALTSLRLINKRITREAAISPDIIQDATSRQVVTAWFTGLRRDDVVRQKWLDAVEQAKPRYLPGETDRFAWLSYQLGDFNRARRWLNQSVEHTPEGKWVQSKLLLRDGKIDEAVEILRGLVPAFKRNANTDVLCELGVIHLGRKEYLEALDLFMRAEYWEDAAYIAEYVLTTDELESVIDQYDQRISRYNDSLHLPTLLSHRYARNRQWDQALLYAEPEYKTQLQTFIEAYKKADYLYHPDTIRGENYLTAGELLRKYGMEMQGTYTDPDWMMYGGSFDLTGPSETRMNLPEKGYSDRKDVWGPELETGVEDWHPQLKEALTAGDEELKRKILHLPQPYMRFHYRYQAANMMWEAAHLLPDNDMRTAKALYLGGIYLKNKHPQLADKYYKALVRRNRNLPIGQAADKRRWFPDSFESFVQDE